MGKKKSTRVKTRLKPPGFTGSPPTNQDIQSVMAKKFDEGLTVWAKKRMGRDFTQYMEQALRNYWTLVVLALAISPNFLTAMRQVPFYIPTRLKRKTILPPFNPLEFKKEYEPLLKKLRAKKNSTRHQPAAQRLALAEALNITDKMVIGKYLTLKASDIALDHLCRKYKLPIGVESLQKLLALTGTPLKLTQRIIGDIATRAGYPIPHTN